MQIVALELQSTRIATRRAHPMAIGTTRVQENTLVTLIAADGTAGYGETTHMVGHSQAGETPESDRAVLRTKLAPAVLGQNPFNQEALALTMNRAVPGNTQAKGAIIMAAYDLAGKLLNTPVYNLLGGQVRAAIPLSWSLGIVDQAAAVAEAQEMVARGWRILKIKVGRPDPSDDVQVVAAVRAAVGDGVRLRADANQAYDRVTALRVARGLADYGLDWLEQPVHRDDLAGMALLTREAPLPIMADESAKSPEVLGEIIRHDAANAISIYIIGPGGLHASKQMAALCQAFRLRGYVGGNLESVIGSAAGLHLAASSPAIDLGCEMCGQYLLTDDIGAAPLVMQDGALVVPTGPGLGVELDPDKLARYRVGAVERIGRPN